jgi:predicted transposase YdaD
MDSEETAGADGRERDFDLHHPHDHFFRRAFGMAETASAFFLRVVPESLRRYVSDPGRMGLENVSFVSEDLRGSQSDLLWRCEAAEEGRAVYVYVLFEHQREPDRLMPVRLLFYLVKIWERHLRLDAAPAGGAVSLPFILPLVLYQGSAPWSAPLFFAEMVEVPGADARGFVPDFTYRLESLQGTDWDEVSPEMLRLVLLVMKLVGRGAAGSGLSLVFEAMERLPEVGEHGKMIRVALLYLFAAARPEDRRAMIQELEVTKTKVRTEARSALEALILDGIEEGLEKGMEKGREEGREEGLQLALERLCASGMKPEDARRLLGLG